MTVVRRAFLFTWGERYVSLGINFVTVAILSRLLTPEEIGISVLGVTVLALAEIVRDVPSSYLVQHKDITRADVRTAFTAMLLVSLVFAAGLVGGAETIAASYGNANLALYLQVLALALLPGPLERPLMALLKRDMAFDRVALVNIITWSINAAVTITLAWNGFSYMSFAIAAVAANIAAAIAAYAVRPEPWAYRPSLREWRHALRFGGYTTTWALLSRASELLTYAILGRLHHFDAVGLYNRALVVSQVPEKLLLSAVGPVAFPALAAEARAGRSLKRPYLTALSLIAAVHWPALLLLALLAHPVVTILLGAQWMSIVPLVRIMAAAALFSFAWFLTYPTLMAAGALRDLVLSSLIAVMFRAVVIAGASVYGLKALALALFVMIPFESYVGIHYIRKHVYFSWAEFAAALRPSAVIALCSAIGPGTVIALAGPEPSVGAAAIAVVLAAIGWVAGLRGTGHPLGGEIVLALTAIRHSRVGRRVSEAGLRLIRRPRTV
jgi:O-antigen/teichoic acid export membrane protein